MHPLTMIQIKSRGFLRQGYTKQLAKTGLYKAFRGAVHIMLIEVTM